MTKATEAKLKTQENLRHWDALKKTDPAHTKPFQRSGGFKGTAMKPIWIVEQMTKHFGPVGEGWGMGEPRFQIVDVSDQTGNIMVYCHVECWHTSRDNVFWGVGGDTVMTKFNSGKMAVDDEAFKKAFTDAVNNALKFIGVGADIHMGQFDDSKYVHDLREQFSRPPEMDKLEQFIEETGLAQTEDDLQAILELHRNAIDTLAQIKPAEVQRAQQQWKARRKAIRDAATKQLEPAE